MFEKIIFTIKRNVWTSWRKTHIIKWTIGVLCTLVNSLVELFPPLTFFLTVWNKNYKHFQTLHCYKNVIHMILTSDYFEILLEMQLFRFSPRPGWIRIESGWVWAGADLNITGEFCASEDLRAAGIETTYGPENIKITLHQFINIYVWSVVYCIYTYTYVYVHIYACSIAQSCPTLCDPLPGSSVHELFQSRILERVAIFYSNRHIHMYTHICMSMHIYV